MLRSACIWTLAISCCTAPCVRGQDENSPAVAEEAAQRDQLFAQLTQLVPDYMLQPQTEAGRTEPFQLVQEPILRWSNPVRQTQDGAVFLWHDTERPAVIMCAFWRSGSDVQIMHEFQSLYPETLTGTLTGRTVWSPREAGVVFQPVHSSPPVAEDARLRLVQMRRIAATYQGYVVPEKQPRERLRMMPHPLHRYGNRRSRENSGLIDGAMFAMVQTTDPEILVLLEARENPAGQSGWYVAFARMSRWPLNVTRAGEAVWSCQWGAGRWDEAYRVVAHDVD